MRQKMTENLLMNDNTLNKCRSMVTDHCNSVCDCRKALFNNHNDCQYLDAKQLLIIVFSYFVIGRLSNPNL